jgi:hypothetical protein
MKIRLSFTEGLHLFAPSECCVAVAFDHLFFMSPRTLTLLCLVFAGAGFAGMHLMVTPKVSPTKPIANEAGVQKVGAAGCESCKNTPTNRFAMLAKQESKAEALPRIAAGA